MNNIEKSKINPWVLNKKRLLEELAIDIAREYWMQQKEAVNLLKIDINKWLSELKNELNKLNDKNLNNLSDKKLEKLFFTLKWALDVIEKTSKNEIEILKRDIEESINIEEFKNNIEDYLPPKLIQKAKYPENIADHILWFALGTANSIFKTAEILYQIWKWLITTPYHLYMIITWKGETNSFREI